MARLIDKVGGLGVTSHWHWPYSARIGATKREVFGDCGGKQIGDTRGQRTRTTGHAAGQVGTPDTRGVSH